MDKTIVDMLRKEVGISDEDLNKLTPEAKRILSYLPELRKYKIFAEVIESKYCQVQCKVGQKFVFTANPLLLHTNESTCPPCIGALVPIDAVIRQVFDNVVEGNEPDEFLGNVKCRDKGLDHGGLGKVKFKVYTVRAA